MGKFLRDPKGEVAALLFYYGFRVGMILVLAPIARDILLRDAREWNLISIGIVGQIIQLIGVYFIHKGGRNVK